MVDAQADAQRYSYSVSKLLNRLVSQAGDQRRPPQTNNKRPFMTTKKKGSKPKKISQRMAEFYRENNETLVAVIEDLRSGRASYETVFGRKPPSAPAPDIGNPIADETIIDMPSGNAVGIAIKTMDDKNTGQFSMLVTIRAGNDIHRVKFGPDSYGGKPAGGVSTMGGGPGDSPEPPCT